MKFTHLWFYALNPSLCKWRKIGFNPDIYWKLTKTYFQQTGFKTVVDIGANTGQSVLTFRLAFPTSTIHAIEPLPDCFAELSRNTASVADLRLYNTALGQYVGTIDMEENEYSPSSSVLALADTHLHNFPHASVRKSRTVNIDTLDNLLGTTDLVRPLLVKIDVQGYEEDVIKGGTAVLSRTDLLLVEVSLEELYTGQPLFDNVRATLQVLGFEYVGTFDELVSPLTGKVLQQDAIFVRK